MTRTRNTVFALALACALGTSPARAQDPEPLPNIPVPAPRPVQDPLPAPKDDPKPAPATDPIPAPPVPATANAPAATIEYVKRAGEVAFDAEVARLALAHPGRLRKTSLGKSRGGRDLVLLSITDLAAGDPDKKPAVLLSTGLDPSFDTRPAGPEAALFAVRALLERADSDPALAALFTHTSVYVLPAPDPDQVFAPDVSLPRACRLDRNFPADWRPWSSETCAQGPYPLSEPETRAIARFFAARTNVGAVVLLSRGIDLADVKIEHDEGELERILAGRIAAEDAAAGVDPKVAAEALVRRSLSFVHESGSLAAFCRVRLSAFVLPLDPFGTDSVDTPFGRAPAGFPRIVSAVQRIALELPRVACTVAKTERLRERLWKLDLEIENQGLLPTISEAERAQCPGSVWFEATGGRVAQVGISRGGAADQNATPRPPAAFLLGHLDGREKLMLHVLVEAAEGTHIELVFKTLREGETRCAATLH